MKKLFVLVGDAGDGSFYTSYTMNEDWIKQQEEGDHEYGDLGCDGDGFHYDVLTVSDECTLESLGISYDCAEDDDDDEDDDSYADVE